MAYEYGSDLRQEFDDILETYGHNVLIVRSDRTLRCTCWNEKTQDADRECPICFGKGWVPVIEKHTVRTQDTDNETALPAQGQGASKIGDVATPGRLYFARYNMVIRSTDLIVDVDWSETGRPIYNGGGIYEVSHVEPMRFDRGRVIFQNVYVRDEPVEKIIRGINIVNTNGIKNYVLIEG